MRAENQDYFPLGRFSRAREVYFILYTCVVEERYAYKWTCSVNFQNSHKHKSALDHDFCLKIDVDFDKLIQNESAGVSRDIKLILRSIQGMFHLGFPIGNTKQAYNLPPKLKQQRCALNSSNI